MSEARDNETETYYAAQHAFASAIAHLHADMLNHLATLATLGPASVHFALCSWSRIIVAWLFDGVPPEDAEENRTLLDTLSADLPARDGKGTEAEQARHDALRVVPLFAGGDHEAIGDIVMDYYDRDTADALFDLMSHSVTLAAHAALHFAQERGQGHAATIDVNLN